MELKIVQENGDERGVFYALGTNESVKGIMTYIWGDDDHMLIDYSNVSCGFENDGIEEALVKAVANYARLKKCKVVPLSSKLKKVAKTDQTIQDVIESFSL